ncbi:hypothetical protein [uncultured Psychrobacter sp.]|uniref:hypothetical protein n=1 Tax=uncultured Psychrobacter sp. TaxID=259303 RepID=UPI00261DBE11|nr:hypothetical protein [uncultured Psychrobacter sp.]
MTNDHKLAIVAISVITVLTGCAESQTFGQGVNTVLNSTVQDIQTALIGTTNTARTNTAASSQRVIKSTDWTPYLRPMQTGCDLPNLDQIPSQYRSSISNIQRQGNPNIEGQDVTTIYNLTNATAFGYPLQKIEKLQGYEWGHVSLYFKDSGFAALRSQFKLPSTLDEFATIQKNDASGYTIDYGMGGSGLVFDAQKRTITCTY